MVLAVSRHLLEQVVRSPCCDVPLEPVSESYRCTLCGERYRSTLGIPDLRCLRQGHNPGESLVVDALVARYSSASFAELAELEMRMLAPPDRLDSLFLRYRTEAVQRGRRIEQMFRIRYEQHFGRCERGRGLDVGCGVGAGLIGMAESFAHVCGIDPYLPDLILARKLLEENGVGNAVLVQAVAQRMPFASNVFDYVSCQNVIEHLLTVEQAFAEIGRVLAPKGAFSGDSRNRFDLLTPEPHVQLRWVGFLPRALMPLYVRLRRKASYRGVRLLSLPELERHLQRTFGSCHRVVFPFVSAYGQSAALDRVLQAIEEIPALRTLVLFFFPSHLALARVDGG